MAYDPRNPNGTPTAPVNNGGRSQPGLPTPAAAPAVTPPTAEEKLQKMQEAEAAGQVANWTAATGWTFRPKTSAELLQAKDATGGTAPPVQAPTAQAPNVPGASTQAPVPPRTPQQILQAGGGPAPGQPQADATGTRQRSTTGAAPGAGVFQPAQTQPGAGSGGMPQVSVDYSRYDQAAQGYDRAVSTFQSELDRLSGVDPFGNQAFLRKATDRAVGQAAGLASGGLSTATARAGNMRQAQGVQASLSAQGIEQQAVQRSSDENQAAQLRLGAAGGLANTLGAKAGNEVELAKLQTQTVAQNVDAYLKKYQIDATLDQQDVESIRQMALGYSGLDMERYKTDVGYAQQQDALLVQRYGIDQQTAIAMKQIAEKENITFGEAIMGTIGAVAGVAGGIASAPKGSMVNPNSDRRLKFDVRDPDLRDLEDFLGRTKGKLYRYKDPTRPGNKPGVQYGFMAQDLAKSKIGKTLVGKNADGTYHVDAARLALADHAALAELAREVKALKAGK